MKTARKAFGREAAFNLNNGHNNQLNNYEKCM